MLVLFLGYLIEALILILPVNAVEFRSSLIWLQISVGLGCLISSYKHLMQQLAFVVHCVHS